MLFAAARWSRLAQSRHELCTAHVCFWILSRHGRIGSAGTVQEAEASHLKDDVAMTRGRPAICPECGLNQGLDELRFKFRHRVFAFTVLPVVRLPADLRRRGWREREERLQVVT